DGIGDLVDAFDVDQRRVHVERDQLEVGELQRRLHALKDEAGGDFCRSAHAGAVSLTRGCPRLRSTSRTIWARSFGSLSSRSMRSFSLPASLMCLFFWISWMMAMPSTGASFLKVMLMMPGAASTLITP